MSTFDGIISEFPGIRGEHPLNTPCRSAFSNSLPVDYFRNVVDDPPLACFLSHIHSDHLAGLDTFRGRLVYCSPATRAMLLKLQRKASRINFAQRILEIEEITYKHQRNRLVSFPSPPLHSPQSEADPSQKALPLNTPTEVELTPNSTIRVTLLDANHCPGAVMFRR